jgi:large subunit ribosomal protein L10
VEISSRENPLQAGRVSGWRIFACYFQGKDFFMEGGECTLAITKERKNEMVGQYAEWVKKSRALIITEYTGLPMKQMDDLRNKMRDAGGEFHVVKNTLGVLAFKEAGLPLPEDYFEGSTAIGFAFQDPPMLAKALTDFARTSDFVKIKGGYLGDVAISADQIKALADLPPLPVMRAMLLGTILAPASKLVRTLAEPGRQIAAVVKAFADKDSAAVEAAPEAAAE